MKEQKVLNYYVLCNRLKDTIRTGWKVWEVQKDRLESVAEHIFGTQMLAIAMKMEYDYQLDIQKVLMMLAVHELGEIEIGDIVTESVSGINKNEIEHAAVHRILAPLAGGEEIEALFIEFDSHATPEAQFAYMCDKLEADLQCRIYDETHCTSPQYRLTQLATENPGVKKAVEENPTWSSAWIKFNQSVQPYDEHFLAVSNYALTHTITDTE